MFTNEELDIVIAALEQYDAHLDSLGRVVPAAAASGQLDEQRGRGFLLLSKARRIYVAEVKRLVDEKRRAADAAAASAPAASPAAVVE